MRTTSILAILTSALATVGCNETCGLGNQLNPLTYDAYVHPIGPWEIQNADHFPAYASPGNGPLQIAFQWGNTNQGPVTVVMDGQSFDGEGVFYEQECGNFEVVWSGNYVSDLGSEHKFATRAQIQFYDGFIAGRVTNYNETWSYAGEIGSYTSEASELWGDSGGGAATTP